MRSKLFNEKPRTAKTSAERWVRVLPDNGEGYQIYDMLREVHIGRILFDAGDNWIYDGEVLDTGEQEDIAGFISGNHKEMEELMRSIQ